MKVGDLVRYQNELWYVRLVDRFRLGVAVLDNAQSSREVPHDLDTTGGEVEVIANPSEEWPFISPPSRGHVTQVDLVRGTQTETLTPYEDWIAPGGSVFFRPSLAPRVGEMFLVHFGSSVVRVLVRRRTLDTFKRRQDRLKVQPKEPLNAYTALLQDDDE
jgi:hypothetical protein